MMQEGFTNAQINYAAYEVLYDVDWNAQAVRNVRNNIEWNSWGSRQQIIDNLKWEGFTESQITHATAFLDSRNVDWYAQAVNTIRNEIENEWFIEHGTTSYRRMIDNLRSWGFTPSQVNHAIAFLDSQDVDWNNQAVNAAQNVMNWSSTQDNGISYNGLVRQLSDDWMSFTLPQATHGANSVGAPTAAIWNAQAVTAASRITSCCCFTTNANENTDRNRMLIERLISSGFTQAQTNHVLTVRDGFTPVENWQFLANQRAVEIQGWGSPREDIIRQLISSGFTQPQTDLALNSIGLSQVPNWQIFANEIAQGFIDDVNGRGFTSRSLIWELIWFGFTREQADNAVSSLIGADWYAEAAKRVKSSSLWGWATSRQGLIDSMVNGDGFTQAQAEQAVSGVSEKLWYDNAILRAAQLNRELLREGKEPSTGLIISIMTDEEGFTLSQAEAAIENASRARYIEAERDALNTLNSTWSQGISREGLIRDLQSEWRGFTQSQAVAAVEAIEAAGDVDWNEQAVKRFEAYVSWGNVGTRDWFIETLTSEWELFTEAQAIQAVPPADDLIWERLAVIVVENRLNLDFEWNQGISRSALIRDLQDMGYSPTTVPAEADPIWVDQAKRSAQWRLDLENEWSQGISRSALIRDLQEQSGFTESQAIAAAPAETDPSWNAHAVRRFQTMVVSWGSTGSRQGFIDQLTNEWNGFTPAQAEHAVPATSDPIWDSMATLEAQRRLDLENEWSQGVSRAALIRELQESGFTPAQALAAVPAEADPIWNAQIIRRAENILLHNPSFFEDATGFIRQLIMDFDFTQEQTNHALTVIPGFTPIADWQSLANQRAAEMQGSSWELDSIIHNLRSSGFTQPQTDAALISIGLGAVDWQAYANRKAQELIASNQGCGPRSLARDLIWQGATHEQADIAVNNLSGVDWYAQAVMRAESFISWGWERSRQQFISQLTGGDGFTQAQADHAVNVVLG
jgi:SOS response regulatory protein OraA/RecX